MGRNRKSSEQMAHLAGLASVNITNFSSFGAASNTDPVHQAARAGAWLYPQLGGVRRTGMCEFNALSISFMAPVYF